jgi:hypothetical protein
LSDPSDKNTSDTHRELPAGIPQNNEPASPNNEKATKKTHTWLEKSAAAIAVLAFLAAASQGWIARDSEKRQLRAYLLFESGKVEKGDLTIKIKNSGITPAYSVQCKLSSNWNGIQGWPKYYKCPRRRVVGEQPYGWPASIDVGGQSEFTINRQFCKPGEKLERDPDNGAPEENTAYISGLIAYQDIFERLYFSRFIARIGPDGTLSVARTWNDDPDYCEPE